ncbi:DUF996 domain-containing protein [Thermococcus sp.]|uniref:DUF996 domain-containing protein n=1 Tax=Thermococcus sp. TaxID=35749 RepID=UPI002633C3CE|nr:DUF996 domain-containing protein [Thermococcus sp.]
MVNVADEKNLGIWGAVVALVGSFIPYAGSVISLVGFIMVLVALHRIGEKVGDDRPFKNYLYAVIASMSVLIIILVLAIGLFGISGMGLKTSESISGSVTVTPGENVAITHEYMEPETGFVMSIVGILLLVVLVVIVIAYFEMKAWSAMYEITGTKEFSDAANWFKWGAVTAIVLIGFLLILVAKIFVIMGFSNMPEEVGDKGTGEEHQEPFVW